MAAPIEIEFTKDTLVNKTTVKKGKKLKFTASVAQSYVNTGVAKYIKKARSK